MNKCTFQKPEHLHETLRLCASLAKNGWREREMISGFLVARVGLSIGTAVQLIRGDITPNEAMQLTISQIKHKEELHNGEVCS